MNTLIVAGSILLIAIGGTLFFKYQDRKWQKSNQTFGKWIKKSRSHY